MYSWLAKGCEESGFLLRTFNLFCQFLKLLLFFFFGGEQRNIAHGSTFGHENNISDDEMLIFNRLSSSVRFCNREAKI